MSRAGFSSRADGFMLAELVAAMAVVAVGLLAAAAGLQHGLNGIEHGRGESNAVFLVEHKLEELRALALVNWSDEALRPGTVTDYCLPSHGSCSNDPAPGFLRRDTTITDLAGPCGRPCKVATVSVVYHVPSGDAVQQARRVAARTMFVSRR